MEEIDLKEMFLYFLNKKIIFITLIILGILAGVIYTSFIQVPMYRSYTTILLTKEESSSTITSNDVNLNRSLVDTYREIIKSRNVLGKVITNLNLDITIDELSNLITVESVSDTEIIKITVRNEDAFLSMTIADEIANVFNTEIVKLYNIQNIGVIDTALLPNSPYNIKLVKTTLLTTLVGLVGAFGIVFIMFYFDTSVKNAEEVERKLGVPVIGNIPMMGGKKYE